MCRAVNIIFGDNFSRRVRKEGFEIGHWYLSPLVSAPINCFPSLECQDPEIGLESMHFRFDHRVLKQLSAGSTNPGPERPGDRATTPSSYFTIFIETTAAEAEILGRPTAQLCINE